MTTKLIGQKVPRVEDDRLLRGQGRYVDDVLPGALELAVLRSPHAHARIVDIDVSEVLDVPGVLAVYTYDDLEGAMADPLPLLIPHPALTHGRTQYALARDEVNHVGEAIAMVVAENRYLAEDAVERIRVDYELLPPVVGLDAARRGEHLVHADVPGNVGARLEQTVGDAAAAIAAAPHRLALDLHIERSASQPLEGRGTAARWDPDSRPPPGVELHPDLDRPARGDRGQARPGPAPGRRDHPRRRRRLRGQDRAPVAGGPRGVDGRPAAGPPGQVHRGPPRALRVLGPRARPRTTGSRSGSTTTGGSSACRWSSGTTTAPTRRTG